MTTKEAYEILKEYNLWRRGKGVYDKVGASFGYSPIQVGEAIDVAIKVLKGGDQ